jgi:hypothetical protein
MRLLSDPLAWHSARVREKTLINATGCGDAGTTPDRAAAESAVRTIAGLHR